MPLSKNPCGIYVLIAVFSLCRLVGWFLRPRKLLKACRLLNN
ncbi:unnamed protein product [Brassica oleracea]|uniref:(rape) hypothetical protein n=1 Tax=Brassica napus TaxID=3708 RepID=A0A816J9L9_BRANA|nr:unnamed protein product [Brassica napus]